MLLRGCIALGGSRSTRNGHSLANKYEIARTSTRSLENIHVEFLQQSSVRLVILRQRLVFVSEGRLRSCICTSDVFTGITIG